MARPILQARLRRASYVPILRAPQASRPANVEPFENNKCVTYVPEHLLPLTPVHTGGEGNGV